MVFAVRKMSLLLGLAGLLWLSSAAHAAVYLGKAEAKREATGYARALCNDLDDCIDYSVEYSYECKRFAANQVECEVQLSYSTDTLCDITVRVTEYSRYYSRRLVYSPDCN